MDIRRIVLFGALGLVLFSLWTNWQKDFPQVTSATVNANTELTEHISSHSLLPNMQSDNENLVKPSNTLDIKSDSTITNPKLIQVQTDVLNIEIDLNQGDVVKAQLKNYPESVDNKSTPISLLQNNPNEKYVANSGLFVVENKEIKTLDFNFETEQSQYKLAPEQRDLIVILKGHDSTGLVVTKQFKFTRGSYLIGVDYDLINNSDIAWKGYMNTQLLRTSPEEDKSSMFHVGSFTGASYSFPGKHKYQKISFKDMSKTNLDENVPGGWIAMQQHYFLSAWVPDVKSTNRFYTRMSGKDYTIGSVSSVIELYPSEHHVIGAQLYVGPEIGSVLRNISPGLDLTVDYGWLWFLSSMLFSLMNTIYSVVANWGWSIVLVTVLIKLAFYKLSATSYKSMANMRRLQPKLQTLRERFGDDKAKLSQATMEFYREEKVNPLGGCLPILVQIPVFIALYWVLIESVELRQAPFIFWIKDLAAADPYHVLPIIMGFTMLIQQRLNPAPPDPMQAKIMMFLPVFFTALFWGFPAGLVLYWIVNNTLSILQQWYITRKYSVERPVKKLMTAK